MVTMSWTAEADKKLLIFLLATNPSIKLDFEGAAKMLTTKHRQCTARAVQEHFKKIKKEVQEDEYVIYEHGNLFLSCQAETGSRKWNIVAQQAGVGHSSHNVRPDFKPNSKTPEGKALAIRSADEEAEGAPSAKRAKTTKSGDGRFSSRGTSSTNKRFEREDSEAPIKSEEDPEDNPKRAI